MSSLGLVYPSLLLIYFGETAYLATHPEDFASGYFSAVPRPVFWPCFVIATLGALIGSQSLILSAFSIVRQAMALDCCPKMRVVHTGQRDRPCRTAALWVRLGRGTVCQLCADKGRHAEHVTKCPTPGSCAHCNTAFDSPTKLQVLCL